MSILRYLRTQLFFLIPVLIGVTMATFLISHVVPGDPARMMAGERASQETVERIRHQLGLDLPIHLQYVNYMKNLFKGELGMSIRNQRPVLDDLKDFFPATLELTLMSLFIVLLVGIPLGILSAVKKDTALDHFARLFSMFGVSMPVFWLGLILLLVFYRDLGWLPGPGRLGVTTMPPPTITGLYIVDSILTGQWHTLLDAIYHIILPSSCLSYVYLAITARMIRSSMLEVMSSEYIRTAEALGFSRKTVIFKYALRNALIPTLTVLGLSFGELLGGAILTETIFAWPGMGKYVVDSIGFLDFPAIMGFTLVISVGYIVANQVVDILYTVLDPQIRLGG